MWSHLDLYFFHDLGSCPPQSGSEGQRPSLDTTRGSALPLWRAYPSGWDEEGEGLHNSPAVAGSRRPGARRSDARRREKFLSYVCAHRSPCISEHWACLLRPLVIAHSDEPGDLRYRLIEYHRMPVTAYLAGRAAPPEPGRLGAHRTPPRRSHPDEALPINDPAVAEFERRYCQDPSGTTAMPAPIPVSGTGNTLTVVGDAARPFSSTGSGACYPTRHQYFLCLPHRPPAPGSTVRLRRPAGRCGE